MSEKKAATTRRNDLDWLRVLAILAVFLYHSMRFFDFDNPWSIKNAVTYPGVQLWLQFMTQWMMPFIFVISAASIYYALGIRSVRKFIKDKVLRLLVPLIVGIFTHSILQVYLERVSHGEFFGSFWQFLPHYFDGLYGLGGNFAWMGMHLWYLEVLFVYCLILLPLFYWLRGERGGRVLRRIGDFLSIPALVYLVFIPTKLILDSVNPDSIVGLDAFGGWGLASYVWFFLGGFLLFSSEKLQQRIRQMRWISLVLALLHGLAPFVIEAAHLDVSALGGLGSFLSARHEDFASWAFILTFLGFGMQYLTRRTRFLDYANEAVLPFYIMHQTVLIAIGYFVVRWAIPDALKWAVIAVVSLASILGLYELLVRRLNVLRFLFGMKLTQRPAPSRVLKATLFARNRPSSGQIE